MLIADRPRLAPSVALDRVGELCLVRHGRWAFSVNGVGRAILESCDGNRSVADILAMLRQTYSVAPDQLEKDLLAFLSDCRDLGVLAAHTAAARRRDHG